MKNPEITQKTPEYKGVVLTYARPVLHSDEYTNEYTKRKRPHNVTRG